MLKKITLKNWRSIRETSVEFRTPLTVFIGANSSGKSNVLDALHFLRESVMFDLRKALNKRGGMSGIFPATLVNEKPMETSLQYEFEKVIPESFQLKFCFPDEKISNAQYQYISKGESLVHKTLGKGSNWTSMSHNTNVNIPDFTHEDDPIKGKPFNHLENILNFRWQILKESFVPPIVSPANGLYDPYVLEPNAENLASVIEFMESDYPEIFAEFTGDLQWLLQHVEKVNTERSHNTIRIFVTEKNQPKYAPTISDGTLRSIAMLVAIHALDLRVDFIPGLVVIEEPDSALNPMLLKQFVELLRTHVSDETMPRQIIMTTHNPMFLNYFQPDEIRIVERDDDGFTVVNEFPENIKRKWVEEEGRSVETAWRSYLLGGVPAL